MAAVIPLNQPGWDPNRTAIYEEVDKLPLMSGPGPILLVLVSYLLFVFKAGPHLMKHREPFKLNTTMVIYNIAQVILSAYLVINITRCMAATGLVSKRCCMDDGSLRKPIIFNIWLYLIAKISELADTVMFVLRKKNNQVTFLHVYHHSIMMVGTWGILKYAPSEVLMFAGLMNSLVHVFMYSYYGLSALGPKFAKFLTWKKHMTKFQLVQFVSIMVQYFASLKISDCPPSKGVALFFLSNLSIFIILFVNFYRKNYTQKQSKKNSLNTVGALPDRKQLNHKHN